MRVVEKETALGKNNTNEGCCTCVEILDSLGLEI